MSDPILSQQALDRRLSRAIARAVTGFSMLAEGDRVMVAMSGGKDSYVLFHQLEALSRRAPIHFTLVPVHIDQGQPGHDPSPLVASMKERGAHVHVARDDTYSIVKDKIAEGKTYCSLCSRLRRAILYRIATELECTKIALGHHRDDTIVTLMLNLMFSGQLKAMPPKLISDDGKHVVIRPMIYCAQDDIAEQARRQQFPILPCNLCGSQPHLQRKAIETLLDDLDKRAPGARSSMIAALSNVRPSHLLDPGLWKKLGLEVAEEASEDGSIDNQESLISASSIVRE